MLIGCFPTLLSAQLWHRPQDTQHVGCFAILLSNSSSTDKIVPSRTEIRHTNKWKQSVASTQTPRWHVLSDTTTRSSKLQMTSKSNAKENTRVSLVTATAIRMACWLSIWMTVGFVVQNPHSCINCCAHKMYCVAFDAARYFITYHTEQGRIAPEWLSTHANTVGALTKPLQGSTFEQHHAWQDASLQPAECLQTSRITYLLRIQAAIWHHLHSIKVAAGLALAREGVGCYSVHRHLTVSRGEHWWGSLC